MITTPHPKLILKFDVVEVVETDSWSSVTCTKLAGSDNAAPSDLARMIGAPRTF